MKNMKALLTVISILCIVVAFAAAEKPKDEFKNLQVLPKNISAEELDKVMDSFNEGLGVKCGYCHVRNTETKHLDFAKDDKAEKEMARNMMRMTNDLNKKYFSDSAAVKAVSCYTCHHGNPMPAVDTADFRKKNL